MIPSRSSNAPTLGGLTKEQQAETSCENSLVALETLASILEFIHSNIYGHRESDEDEYDIAYAAFQSRHKEVDAYFGHPHTQVSAGYFDALKRFTYVNAYFGTLPLPKPHSIPAAAKKRLDKAHLLLNVADKAIRCGQIIVTQGNVRPWTMDDSRRTRGRVLLLIQAVQPDQTLSPYQQTRLASAKDRLYQMGIALGYKSASSWAA